MSDEPSPKTLWVDPDWPLAEDGNPVIKILIPQALKTDVEEESWRPGTPILLLTKLAIDHFFKQPTLTRDQLAELVELFKDEPLPDSLREALVAELLGKRRRKSGRNSVRRGYREEVERVLLPCVYDHAMEEVRGIRERLKSEAKKLPRRAAVSKVPTRRSIALDMVRDRLPSFADVNNGRLTNLISEVRTLLCDGDGLETGGQPKTGSE